MLFEKNTDQKYIVGFDLRDDFCQMSYMEFTRRTPVREPKTYAPAPEGESFNIPTAIAKTIGVNKWYCGQEAVQASYDGSATYIPGLLSLALDGAPVKVEADQYEAAALLALYIRRCLMLLGAVFQTRQILAVMFTCRTMERPQIELLEKIRPRLELPEGCGVYYEAYANSFYHYLLMQEMSIREPASLLCEMDAGGQLRIGKLKFNQKTRPIVSYMEEKVYPGIFAEEPADRDEEFARILQGEIARPADYASAFLIGNGFQGGWMNQSLRILCTGRRAFMGSNLYSKGAVYSGWMRMASPDILKNYYYLDKNHVRTNIGIRALRQGSMVNYPILDAGVNWYEAGAELDVLIEDGNDLYLQLTPLTGGGTRDYLIRLEGLVDRPGRTSRIRIRLTMNGPDKAHVLLEDLGFGEIFPSTGLKWEQEVSLESNSEK